MTVIELNSDSFEIKNYELTSEGFLKFWLVGGVPDKELVYDGGKRKEVINSDALFNEDSLSTAVGKPVTHNHPPRPVNAKNYREYSLGTVLQEYSKDENTGALVLSGIVHDGDLVQSIMKGDTKYVSASYAADKTPNDDGVLMQSNRKYNHFAILSSDHSPRAGEESKIIMLDDTVQKDFENKDTKKEETDTKTPIISNNDVKDIEERVELLATWKPVLEENKRSIDYQLDSSGIKRLVLSCYYPEKTIKALNEDSVLKGFWLNFVTNQDSSNAGDDESLFSDNSYKLKTPNNNRPLNFDSSVDSPRDKYIAMMEGKK